MSHILISTDKKSVAPEEAAVLYISLGWGTARRYSIACMKRSLENCDIVVSARNEAGELVGIARALSDFALDTKILDMAIDPDYQKQGIGRAMFKKIESLAKGTAIYGETARKHFLFMEKCGYKKRKELTVFMKKGS